MLKKAFFVSLIFSISICCFAQRVISPVSGNFSNKQVLVLDTSDGAECFYSFSGTDPLTSGFAYDGPVLIDAVGRVNVRIAAVSGNSKEEIEINFNVRESSPYEADSEESTFVSETVNSGLFTYSYDNPLKIPSGFTYCLGDGEKPFLKGRGLSLDPSSRLSRYIACNVTDGTEKYRFVIFVPGGEPGTLSKFTVPFAINDWNEFVFNGEKLIWSIDDGMWSASKVPVKLDRSVPHTISWQSIVYEKGNPVQSFVLPPEPELVVSSNPREPATFTINGDIRYRMEILSSGAEGQASDFGGLFTTCVFDTFEGDAIYGHAEFAFFCDGVYQGKKAVSYCVDKQPPLAPKFVSENKSFYARGEVALNIEASEPEASIYYAVSKPYKIPEEKADDSLEALSPEFNGVDAGNFAPYSDSIVLSSGSESAVFYKVKAYAVDKFQNISEVSEYRVVIDEYNYYIDSNGTEGPADGSRKNPFTSLKQAFNTVNSSKYSHFYVKGSFTLPEEEVLVSSNCSFTGIGESSSLIIPSGGSLLVRGASFEAKNLFIQKEASSSNVNEKLFVLENSTLNLNHCEVSGIFQENGTLFSARNSVIELLESGITVNASVYGCAVSGQDSKIYCRQSRVSSVAQTAVNFSQNGGIFECRNSDCRVTAHLGRIAELSDTNIRMTGNKWSGEFDKKIRGLVPVWKDNSSLLLEDKNNSAEGF